MPLLSSIELKQCSNNNNGVTYSWESGLCSSCNKALSYHQVMRKTLRSQYNLPRPLLPAGAGAGFSYFMLLILVYARGFASA